MSTAAAAGVPSAQLERRVLAETLYLARFATDWPLRPFWMLRRCVVPHVAAGQFMLLRREGVPAAFAGWAFERDGEPTPWREYRYLPSAGELSQGREGGRLLITEMISPFLPLQRVAEEVARFVGLAGVPPWIEFGADRQIVAIHEGEGM